LAVVIVPFVVVVDPEFDEQAGTRRAIAAKAAGPNFFNIVS
jgi:hypothetical protein